VAAVADAGRQLEMQSAAADAAADAAAPHPPPDDPKVPEDGAGDLGEIRLELDPSPTGTSPTGNFRTSPRLLQRLQQGVFHGSHQVQQPDRQSAPHSPKCQATEPFDSAI
ncbi:unnamed protein product, partial [Polarella glacialis]